MNLSHGADAPLVVGFDGSPASHAALRWALDHAQSVGATVQVVTSYDALGGESIDVARMNAEATGHLAAKEADPTAIEVSAVQGEPIEVLLARSEDAELLVVGRHGTSGIIHSALGSVGDACARLAACAVVIVPPDRRDADSRPIDTVSL